MGCSVRFRWRLAAYLGAFAVAVPALMTWLGLSVVVGEARGLFALIGSGARPGLRAGALARAGRLDV
jgi:hypothetical protein